MQYAEILPDDVYSHHVESYWHLSAFIGLTESPTKWLLPTCTFNIIFTDKPCFIKTKENTKWVRLNPGATFFGQRKRCIQLKSKHTLNLCGIRFKPFAFSQIIDIPIFKLNDEFSPIDHVFTMNRSISYLIQQIIKSQEFSHRADLMNDLMSVIFKKTMSIDETLRAQLNYIMNRRGSIKVSDLFGEFKVSKVTLRKHFINKVGLTPKKVSQIWRMNYMFQMKEDWPEGNLTTLCYEAGYYDQAHFIKDFRLLFEISPLKFFNQNTDLVRVAHHNISKRFTNQYDPR